MAWAETAPHIECLMRNSKVEIKEKVNLIEAITAIIGQEVEMANKYKIFADGGENELFFAVEKTDCCTRQAKQCCPDCAPWDLDILYTEGGNNTVAYNVHRDSTCTCLCFNRPSIEVKDMVQGKSIGSVMDPFACCDLTFTMTGAGDNGQDGSKLKANGGCCQWGLCCPLPCGPCAEVNFPITDDSGNEVGHVQKKVPGCCKFFFAPDVQNYMVDFGNISNPDYRALVLAFSIFLDFRYFNDNSNDDEGGLLGELSE
mmetsp:Transcript_15308/g.43784  ORF Transcript_15308/g.43784 Transcript_15308/m.43784 type:complete len:257 (-) Transcript_15308:67-837(-)